MDKLTNREKAIYDRLADERSREVFLARKEVRPRYRYGFNRGEYIDCMARVSESDLLSYNRRLEALVDETIKRGCKYVLYARSGIAARLANLISKKDSSNCLGIWDINKELEGFELSGLKVHQRPSGFKEDYKDLVVLGTLNSEMTIEDADKYLISIGVNPQNIMQAYYCQEKVYISGYFFEQFIKSNLGENEVFVDAGVLDLADTLCFFEQIPGKGFAYAFEPSIESYAHCKNKIKTMGLENVELVNAALWSSDGTLSFEQSPLTPGSNAVSEGGNLSVNGVRLDTYLNGRDVSFIKMDIEGAELEALKGAENTICRCKPKLAICIYHKANDYVDIPEYIWSICPDYEMYMRHYTDTITETVLFAVAKE